MYSSPQIEQTLDSNTLYVGHKIILLCLLFFPFSLYRQLKRNLVSILLYKKSMPITYTQVITINNQLGTSSEIRNPRARTLKKLK